MIASSPLRLYAVIPRRVARISRMRGIERELLQQVRTGTVWLVVGRARKPMRPTRANLLAYDHVVRRIDEASSAILPGRFGEVVENQARLNSLASGRDVSLKKALDAVAHKTQMTLRLHVPDTSAGQRNRESATRSPTLQLRRGRAAGRTYLEARAAAFRPPRLPEIEVAHRALGSLVQRENFRTGPAAGAVTLYHLIEKGQGPAYRAAVRKCAADMPGVRIQASGPFPPYAFTDDIW